MPPNPQLTLAHHDKYDPEKIAGLDFYSLEEAEKWLQNQLLYIAMQRLQHRARAVTGQKHAVLLVGPEGPSLCEIAFSPVQHVSQSLDGCEIKLERH